MHLSICRPPPPRGVGLTWGFDDTSGQIPPKRILCSIPLSTGGFEPQAVAQIKKSLLLTMQSQVKSPSMGPTFQSQIHPYVPGPVVGQHVDGCITTFNAHFFVGILNSANNLL